VFVALPAPGYLAAVGSPLAGASDVDAVASRGHALAAILRAEISGLAGDGVAYVALGNPLYVPLLTVAGRAWLDAAGVDADAVLAAMLDADRAAVSGLNLPAEFRVGLDLTDSGPLPATSAGYDAVALETLLDETPFQRLCVDYPEDSAARLPIELVKPGLVVSLGVIDVSAGELETVDALLRRLDPVLDQRGESDVAVATNGGFAQSAARPLVSEETQLAKLRLVETTARYYWGNEI
jgi:5-methyltetrahydropteroyltriglutamate--homocysteine methyltransferase